MSIFLRLLTFTGLPCLGWNDEQSGPKLRMLAASCHVGLCENGIDISARQAPVPKKVDETLLSRFRFPHLSECHLRTWPRCVHFSPKSFSSDFTWPIEITRTDLSGFASFCIVSSRFTGTWKMHTFSDLSTFCRLVNGWLQGICSLAAQAPAWFKWVEGSTLGFQSTCPHPDLHRKQVIFSN